MSQDHSLYDSPNQVRSLALSSDTADICTDVVDAQSLPVLQVGFTVSMIWHQRHNNRPQHQWLRSQLTIAAQYVSDL